MEKVKQLTLDERTQKHAQKLVDDIGDIISGLYKTYSKFDRVEDMFKEDDSLEKMVVAQMTHMLRNMEIDEVAPFVDNYIKGNGLVKINTDSLDVEGYKDMTNIICETIKSAGVSFFRWKTTLGVVSLTAWAIKDSFQMRKALTGSRI